MGDNNWTEIRSADELEYGMMFGGGGVGKWTKRGTDDGGVKIIYLI